MMRDTHRSIKQSYDVCSDRNNLFKAADERQMATTTCNEFRWLAVKAMNAFLKSDVPSNSGLREEKKCIFMCFRPPLIVAAVLLLVPPLPLLKKCIEKKA